VKLKKFESFVVIYFLDPHTTKKRKIENTKKVSKTLSKKLCFSIYKKGETKLEEMQF
jgi:hypothetical protein